MVLDTKYEKVFSDDEGPRATKIKPKLDYIPELQDSWLEEIIKFVQELSYPGLPDQELYCKDCGNVNIRPYCGKWWCNNCQAIVTEKELGIQRRNK